MKLTELNLHHFRNYDEAQVEFSPQINVLIGENAQGKTNLLESIYVLAMTRSHRTNNDRKLIEFGKDAAQIKGTVQRELGSLKLELDIGKHGKKAKANHLEKARLSEYLGQLNVILFAPEDLALVKGAPTVRRRFIDMEFGQVSPKYLHDLTQYRDILKQRNRYLKQLQSHEAQDQLYLEVLSEQLAAVGGAIISQRVKFLSELEGYAQELHQSITQGRENLTFEYSSAVKDASTLTEVELSEALMDLYRQNQSKEIFQGTTLYGPHRDDVRFLINHKNVQTYGSQGQQRTTALSVKLAEIDLMKNQTGEYPILLLDDVLSELDGARQTHLLKTIQDKVQTFLTTPGLSDVARNLIKEPRIFHICDGQIIPEKQATLKTEVFYPTKQDKTANKE
ncbi:DNA replication/repair protein RecF [Ligilactobacillus aviarius]|uniref:DNA replication/repair protein RecF n=1 Tax=Ligilactobacillus aviarius TaxID=1606 RepID=UPI0007D9E58E|nr:DNA replication/repair protein RecF [Ligilactobacillus aviarius]OAQ03745.1 DNA replication/repair protein RecF [Ligilactobacillus aviarius]OAQ05596.1 DNA replication/repair protein RecF [Ligilactobacillus aviarius]OAS79335.1 DNA replication/repair protein RecF [Ligilactobacillus aviarius]PEG71180.1 DNA replication and repair protein RecF [Ligilactobacillus aviarius]PEG74452.1 DNA replication and repair protein RecF [Ligilactobacillus aviarius]